jgi:flagellar biosynthesis/type III secretory pathway protein FliH
MTSSDAVGNPAPSAWRRNDLLASDAGQQPSRFRSDGSILDMPFEFVPAAAPPAVVLRDVGTVHVPADSAEDPQNFSDSVSPLGESASSDVQVETRLVDAAAVSTLPTGGPDSALLESSRAEAYSRGFEAGLAEGLRRAREASEAGTQETRKRIEDLMSAISDQVADGRQFYKPLEKLALHIASELVRGTLALSPSIVERLIQLSLAGLQGGEGKITVRLNPEDAELLLGAGQTLAPAIDIIPSQRLSRGSVVVEAAGKLIEDLLEDRLKTLATGLLGLDDLGTGMPDDLASDGTGA